MKSCASPKFDAHKNHIYLLMAEFTKGSVNSLMTGRESILFYSVSSAPNKLQ